MPAKPRIHARRRRHDRLRGAARLFALFPEAIAVVDASGRLIEGNVALRRLLGGAELESPVIGEALSTGLTERLGLSPQTAARFHEALAGVLAGERRSFRIELEALRGGATRWFIATAGPLAAARGKGAVVQLRDVSSARTERRALEGRLPMVQVLIDAIPGPVFYKDEHGLYRGCNRAFEAYTGLSRGDVVGKTVSVLGPKHLADIYYEKDQALMRERGVQIYETQVRYADGSLHDVMFHKATFDHRDGSVAGILGVMLDITTRKQAENELKRHEEQLRIQTGILETIVRSMDDGVLVADRAGAVILANPAAKRLLEADDDIAPEDLCRALLSSADGSLMAPEALPLARALSGESVDRIELAIRGPSGLRFIDAVARPLRADDGTIEGAITVLQDVTEQRQRMRSLEQQNQQMSAPILEIWSGVLAVPIVGAIDAVRASRVLESLLQRVSSARCRMVFIDLTGIEAIDAATAEHFVRLVTAVELLGAACFITGIGPLVAQTLVAFGASLGPTQTYQSLKHALRASLGLSRRRRPRD